MSFPSRRSMLGQRLFEALSRTITSSSKKSTSSPSWNRQGNSHRRHQLCCAPSTARGRVLTDRVVATTSTAPALDQAKRDAVVQDMSAFIRMYEPHEAREDTVVFPALRQVVPAKEFRDMADTFEDEEHRRFGQAGFEGVVDKVADIEKSVGIYDLNQFTPT